MIDPAASSDAPMTEAPESPEPYEICIEVGDKGLRVYAEPGEDAGQTVQTIDQALEVARGLYEDHVGQEPGAEDDAMTAGYQEIARRG